MIGSSNVWSPPPLPSSDAIQAAYAVFAVIADPAVAKAQLDQLVAHIEEIRAATAEHEAAAKRAEDRSSPRCAGSKTQKAPRFRGRAQREANANWRRARCGANARKPVRPGRTSASKTVC